MTTATRKEIRDRVESICLASVPELTAITGRTAKIADDILPVVAIYFTAGQNRIENMSGGVHIDGDLTVDFISAGNDDVIDEIADACVHNIRFDETLFAMSRSLTYVNFEYVRDPQTTTSTLRFLFNIVYIPTQPPNLVTESGDNLVNDLGNNLVG